MLSLVIPAHDEKRNISECVSNVRNILQLLGLNFEILAVDDHSQDQTPKISGNLAKDPQVQFFRNQANMGKGSAIKLGFQNSHNDVIAYMDVDIGASLTPQRMVHYLEILDRADVVIASKRHPLSEINYPFHRRVLSRAFNLLVRFLFRLPLSDTQCGFKFFKRKVIEDIMPRLLVKRYAFDVELLVNLHRRGYRIVEAPIKVQHGESRVTVKEIWRMAIDTLAIFYRLHFTKTYS
ncbi:MAG: glycosyltransferase [Nitrososphaeria archaeon]|nr:glycosyltransferase [Nitrososphaeria archaeon]